MSILERGSHQFESNVIPGAVVVDVFAVLSTIALLSVAVRVAWLAAIPLLKGESAQTSPREYVFFRTQLGIYSICILTANLFNSVAGVIGLTWLRDGGITEGNTCTTQAVITQIGNISTAYFTAAIAIHAFNALVLRKQSVWLSLSVIAVGWCSALAAATLPMLPETSQGPLYGDTGVTCGIRAVYPKAQFFLHLFPIFLASSTSVIMYSIVFLVLRGTLVVKGGIRFTLDPHKRWGSRIGSSDEYQHFVAAIARSMLWYPVAYIMLLLPYSIVRLLVLSGFAVPFGATVFAFVCWYLLGFVNVLLLYNTFRVLGPVFNAHLDIRTPKDAESFFSPVKVTQSNSLVSPLSPALTGIDEKITYNFPTRYPARSIPYSPAHQSTPSASSGASNHPLLAGHRSATNMDSPTNVLITQSLQRTISPYAELKQQLIAMPEPSRQIRELRVDPNVLRSQTPQNSPSLTPAPRYTRSRFERRPTLESISSSAKVRKSFDGSDSALEDFNTVGRPNHRHPPLSAVVQRTSFGPSRTSTSDYGTEESYRPSPPPSARVRSRQSPVDSPHLTARSRSFGNLHSASTPRDFQHQVYSPGMVTRVLPAPRGRSKSAVSPSVAFDPSAMVRKPSTRPSTSPRSDSHAARVLPKHQF